MISFFVGFSGFCLHKELHAPLLLASLSGPALFLLRSFLVRQESSKSVARGAPPQTGPGCAGRPRAPSLFGLLRYQTHAHLHDPREALPFRWRIQQARRSEGAGPNNTHGASPQMSKLFFRMDANRKNPFPKYFRSMSEVFPKSFLSHFRIPHFISEMFPKCFRSHFRDEHNLVRNVWRKLLPDFFSTFFAGWLRNGLQNAQEHFATQNLREMGTPQEAFLAGPQHFFFVEVSLRA